MQNIKFMCMVDMLKKMTMGSYIPLSWCNGKEDRINSVVYDDFRDDCIYGYNFLDESVRRNLSICGACKTTLQAAIEEYMSS